jgi:hypothetical protein
MAMVFPESLWPLSSSPAVALLEGDGIGEEASVDAVAAPDPSVT